MKHYGKLLLVLTALALLVVSVPLRGPVAAPAHESAPELSERHVETETEPASHGPTPCIGGMAGIYPCHNVDLLSHLPLDQIGGGSGNDLWGWTDPLTGREYAIMGRSPGTSFVDVTDPEHPVYLGNLPPHTLNSTWRDIKVHADHAFVVSEAEDHGLQVFDLTQLRSVASPPVTFGETAHYAGFGPAHNVVINEDTGYAYVAGSHTCSAGLHMLDISDPTNPVFAGCVSDDGYVHDSQCVVYHGPDPDHQGREICFNCNEDTLTIVDVTNKTAPQQLSRTGYAGSGYTHQGWLTEDQAHFFMSDELDEVFFGHNTRTWVVDVSDLDAPTLMPVDGPTAAIDHNLYIVGDLVYEANYRAGLSVLRASAAISGVFEEVGAFDIFPASDSADFSGAWSVYPFFDSGSIAVSGIEQGLFVLRLACALVEEGSTALEFLDGAIRCNEVALDRIGAGNNEGAAEMVEIAISNAQEAKSRDTLKPNPGPCELDRFQVREVSQLVAGAITLDDRVLRGLGMPGAEQQTLTAKVGALDLMREAREILVGCVGLDVDAVFFDLGDTLGFFPAPGALFQLFGDARPTVQALKDAGIRVGIITNFSGNLDDLRNLMVEPDFLDEFEVVAISSQVGFSKPDPRIYTAALGLLGSPPPAERAAFVTETIEHIADTEIGPTLGARAAGMVGILKADSASSLADHTVIDLISILDLL